MSVTVVTKVLEQRPPVFEGSNSRLTGNNLQRNLIQFQRH
jgi:hypothetical protein